MWTRWWVIAAEAHTHWTALPDPSHGLALQCRRFAQPARDGARFRQQLAGDHSCHDPPDSVRGFRRLRLRLVALQRTLRPIRNPCWLAGGSASNDPGADLACLCSIGAERYFSWRLAIPYGLWLALRNLPDAQL